MFSQFSFLNNFFDTNYKRVNFEDVQHAIKTTDKFLIINTLPNNEQECLIQHTISIDTEEKIINEFLSEYNISNKYIIVYGKNTNDITVEKRYKQLLTLGFQNVYIYIGGLFEWLNLQDIYGFAEFPTTKKIIDILKYKPTKYFDNRFITNF